MAAQRIKRNMHSTLFLCWLFVWECWKSRQNERFTVHNANMPFESHVFQSFESTIKALHTRKSIWGIKKRQEINFELSFRLSVISPFTWWTSEHTDYRDTSLRYQLEMHSAIKICAARLDSRKWFIISIYIHSLEKKTRTWNVRFASFSSFSLRLPWQIRIIVTPYLQCARCMGALLAYILK